VRVLSRKRNNQIRDIIYKLANQLGKYVDSLGIEEIIIGYNEEWKQKVNLGKRTNQNFVSIPYAKIIDRLTSFFEERGIKVTRQEESYTSKIDHLAHEPMQHQDSYLGHRKNRGLFVSSTLTKKNKNQTLNADINGAIGIMRKCKGESVVTQIANRGVFNRPRTVYIQRFDARNLRSASNGFFVRNSQTYTVPHPAIQGLKVISISPVTLGAGS
jgi:IS605 OrfB family transposase